MSEAVSFFRIFQRSKCKAILLSFTGYVFEIPKEGAGALSMYYEGAGSTISLIKERGA